MDSAEDRANSVSISVLSTKPKVGTTVEDRPLPKADALILIISPSDEV